MRRVVLFAPAFFVLAIAGCGGGGSSSSSKTTPATTTAATQSVGLGSTSLGKILIGANGRTLYLFEKDTGPKSTCNGGCVAVWAPYTTTGKPTAASGVDSAKLTTSKRSDGKSQVVYGGHPLYYYISDTKAGDTRGQNVHSFGADWYVVSAAGQKVEKSSSSSSKSSSSSSGSSSGTSTSSGGGYGGGGYH